ncbi:MAG: hypothetical protein AB8B77_06410 [Alphaproteobacteria bacterium]
MIDFKFPKYIPDPIDPLSRHIQFDLTMLATRGKYSIKALEKKQPSLLFKLKDKLQSFHQLTLHEFQVNPSVRLKLLKGRKIPAGRPAGLDGSIAIDDPIYEFRIDGKFRVMGYLPDNQPAAPNNVFFVIWLDPDHRLAG